MLVAEFRCIFASLATPSFLFIETYGLKILHDSNPREPMSHRSIEIFKRYSRYLRSHLQIDGYGYNPGNGWCVDSIMVMYGDSVHFPQPVESYQLPISLLP